MIKMAFNWDKFSDVGLCLKKISQKEEYQRSATGRFYYAAFGLVKEYYEEKYERPIPFLNAHSFLINELEKSYGDEKRLGENLRKMRKYRNFADYNKIFYLFNADKCEKTYNEIVQLLNNLNKKSKR